MTDGRGFPHELHGFLWHTTHPDRYRKILDIGFILPDPPVPDCDRWCTGSGAEYFPFVRILGGVSLFDFDGFDPEGYDKKYQCSTWREFVPYRRSWGASVWIEVSRHAITDHFVSSDILLAKWHQEKAHAHNIMPKIEAAYLGSIPVSAFKRVLISADNPPSFKEVPIESR